MGCPGKRCTLRWLKPTTTNQTSVFLTYDLPLDTAGCHGTI
jgi:hypothetical protein